jgi:hypothetical protein
MEALSVIMMVMMILKELIDGNVASDVTDSSNDNEVMMILSTN